MNPGVTRIARRLAGGLATAGLVAGLSLAATAPALADDPAPAPGPDGTFAPKAVAGTTSVYGAATDTSTKRKKLRVLLNAGDYAGTGSLSVSLSLGDETHSWQFQMPGKDLNIKSTGAGTLRSKATGPFGTVALKIVPQKAWKVEKCRGQVVSKTRPVVLKGAFLFDTKAAWGAVGSRSSFSLKGTVSKVTGDGAECLDDVCPSAGGGWSYSQGNAFLNGYWRAGADTASISAYRSVSLSKPRGASRYDFRTVTVPVPELVPGEGDAAQLKVAGGSGGATGSATLSAELRSPYDVQCGGSSYTTTSWFNGSFTNGSTALTVRMSVFGDIELADGTGASFSRTTKS